MARSRRDSLVVLHAGDDPRGSFSRFARPARNSADLLVVLHAGDDPKEDVGQECSDLAITATTHQLEKKGIRLLPTDVILRMRARKFQTQIHAKCCPRRTKFNQKFVQNASRDPSGKMSAKRQEKRPK